ncbi:MAG: cation-efflux pump [Clostridiales bacterium]|jgi:cation diffusion facilitator family transporter|nr:cation-efflux pump [Eubacteriales bacterium]MDH7567614.1 cation-efflux pump [Clostridiales bacterium]
MSSEKQKAALSSVVAAVFLTLVKIGVGVFTGSLGILSEAAHSALDLGAAFVTFFAVRISDKPADREHHYGHGKVESFSALIETLLLLATCGWIIYEAMGRLFWGRMVSIEADKSVWGMAVMVLSIAINVSRSRVLKRTAKKYGSQALEADALHFDTDVWSSLVVIAGLVCAGIGDLLGIPALQYGDPVAALGVSALVIVVSVRMGKKTVDVLLDTAPEGMVESILNEVKGVPGVLEVSNIRVRPSGPNYFIDLCAGIGRNESHRVVHSIVDSIRENLQKKIPNSDIVISTFPVDVAGMQDMEIYQTIKKIVDRFPVCTNIHNIHVYDVSSKKNIAIHIEVKEPMSLEESHELSHTIAAMIQEAVEGVEDVSVNFEYVKRDYIQAQDITAQSGELIRKIDELMKNGPDRVGCHDIKVYREGDRVSIFLHCELCGSYTTEKIEAVSRNVSDTIKENIDGIENIHIHVEPAEE